MRRPNVFGERHLAMPAWKRVEVRCRHGIRDRLQVGIIATFHNAVTVKPFDQRANVIVNQQVGIAVFGNPVPECVLVMGHSAFAAFTLDPERDADKRDGWIVGIRTGRPMSAFIFDPRSREQISLASAMDFSEVIRPLADEHWAPAASGALYREHARLLAGNLHPIESAYLFGRVDYRIRGITGAAQRSRSMMSAAASAS